MRLINWKTGAAVAIMGSMVMPLLFAQTNSTPPANSSAGTAGPNASSRTAAASTPTPAENRMQSVRLASIPLRTGEIVSGRIVTEDRNSITLAQVQEGRIVVNTFAATDFNVRDVSRRAMSELEYFISLGEQFASQTWNFKFDPDDFTQAIRAYEQAAEILARYSDDASRLQQIRTRLEQLRKDKQVWEEQTIKRAELLSKEDLAEMDKRYDELSRQYTELAKSVEQLKGGGGFQAVVANLTTVTNQLQTQVQIQNRDIDELYRRLQFGNQQHYFPPTVIYPDRPSNPPSGNISVPGFPTN